MQDNSLENKKEMSVKYGGFWRRLTAYLIDYIAIMVLIIVIMMGLMLSAGPSKIDPKMSEIGFWINFFMVFLLPWLYFALWESSPKQATIGKMLMGLKVTDLAGQRISFLRATGRYFSKILSAWILMIGFLMIAWTQKKQGLHDKIASTLVIHKLD